MRIATELAKRTNNVGSPIDSKLKQERHLNIYNIVFIINRKGQVIIFQSFM